jgi:hypothetical protein
MIHGSVSAIRLSHLVVASPSDIETPDIKGQVALRVQICREEEFGCKNYVTEGKFSVTEWPADTIEFRSWCA